MIWARMLAYITGTVDRELLLRNEYLAAENRILRVVVFAVIHIEDLRNPKALNSDPQSRADGV